MKVKELLAIEIPDEIKNVIDVQNLDENAVESEISEYIVTEKLAEHFSTLIEAYKSLQKETGIWISGFYGSGKSYFAKIFGHLLGNKSIKGTQFSERFIGRLQGLHDVSILENEVKSLSRYKTHVVYLDIGKAATDVKGGLSYTLFKSFLKSLGFSTDKFGYMEFYLYLNDEYDSFKKEVKKLNGKEWPELKKNRFAVPKVVEDLLNTGFSNKYNRESIKNLEETIKAFSPDILAEELEKYLTKNGTDRVVFIMDEVSEAISINKINLLDLQAISESLSGIGSGRIWTIACAQEKLDAVVTNASIDFNELSKVQDRFKTRIHLSSEDVNEVIEKRLLNKSPEGSSYLDELFSRNEGTIADISNLQNSTINTKTENAQEFVACYPFYKYQFFLMANFLFKVNKMVKSGGTERGMIIAFHGVMKNIKDENADTFVSAWQLNDEGQKNPDSELIRKYGKASVVYKNEKIGFDGSQILKVINFLNESVDVDATLDNITKTLISDISRYYEIKPEVETSVELLESKNLIINKQGKYSISSDVEAKLLEEKRTKHIQTHLRKRYINERLKELSFLSRVRVVSYKDNKFNISIEDEDENEILSSKNSYIKLGLSNILNIENKDEFIEEQKYKLQLKENSVLIIPNIDQISQINSMVTDILQYKDMEGYYGSDSDERVKDVINDFRKNRQEKENKILKLLETAYTNGILIQGYSEKNLNSDNCNSIIESSLQETISNTFTDLLPASLNEDLSKKLLKQYEDKKLKSMFSESEFEFFDNAGTFIGSRLKVIEELTNLCSKYQSGSDIEDNFKGPTYGWTYGTINVALAVLMRAGNLKIKAEGVEIFDYKTDNELLLTIFGNSTKFKRTLFQVISENLEPIQKQQIVENLNKIKARDIVEKDFNTHTNDIALVAILKNVMSTQYQKYQLDIEKRISYFTTLKMRVNPEVMVLQDFNLSVDDSNFKDVAENYLKSPDKYNNAVELVKELKEFCEEKLEKLSEWADFVSNVLNQFQKTGISKPEIEDLSVKWNNYLNLDPVDNYVELNNIHQKIRDEYNGTFSTIHEEVSDQYNEVKKLAEDLIHAAEEKSKTLNADVIRAANLIIQDAERNICKDLSIFKKVECKNCSRSLNETLMAKDLVEGKKDDIENLKFKIREETKDKTKKPIIKETVKIPSRELPAKKYKEFLSGELKRLENVDEDSTIFVISLD